MAVAIHGGVCLSTCWDTQPPMGVGLESPMGVDLETTPGCGSGDLALMIRITFFFDIPVLFEFLPVSVSEPCFNLRFISARISRGAHIIILLMVRTIFTRNPI